MNILRRTSRQSCALGVVAVAMLAMLPTAVHAQTSVYLDYGATMMNTDQQTIPRQLFGPIGGLEVNLRSTHHVDLGADFRGSYLQESGANAASMTAFVLGPRLATHYKRVKPYGEFMMGFARYNNNNPAIPNATTDSEVELNAGVDYAIKKHFDWRVFEYSWAKYLADSGEFNPRTYSTGVVFHF
jgi:outer membrane protein with beta-barrel domain